MTKQEIAQYQDKKPIAVYPMGSWGGIEILDIINGIDDYVIWRYNYGSPDKLHKAKVLINDVGHQYIRISGSRVKLDNFMRV
jgi:hypothetical protein